MVRVKEFRFYLMWKLGVILTLILLLLTSNYEIRTTVGIQENKYEDIDVNQNHIQFQQTLQFSELIFPTNSNPISTDNNIRFIISSVRSVNILSLGYDWDSGVLVNLNPNEITFSIPAVNQQGPHRLRLHAEIENVGNLIDSYVFIFDDEPPTLLDIEGLPSVQPIKGRLNINVSVTDLWGFDKAELYLTKNNFSARMAQGFDEDLTNTIQLNFNSLLLADGEYITILILYDQAGNTRNFEYTIEIDNVINDPIIVTDPRSQQVALVVGAISSLILIIITMYLARYIREKRIRDQLEILDTEDRERFEQARSLYYDFKKGKLTQD